MGMTMTQKILAAHAGLDHVEAGQLIEAKLDVVMANDITGPMALPILKQMSDTVFDKNKVVFVPDHFTPNKDIKSAENSKAIREFAKALICSMTAQAMLSPSNVLVPRPISSSIKRLLLVAFLKIFATSVISTINVL